MRAALAYLLAAALGALCAVAVGCGGGSKLLQGSDAASLKQSLTQVRQAVDERDCSTATSSLDRLRTLVGNLPGTVDRGLRVDLRREINGTLAPQAATECAEPLTQVQPTFTSPAPVSPDTQPTAPATDTVPPTPSTDTAPSPAPSGPTGPDTVPGSPTDPAGTGGALGDGTLP